MVRQAGGKVQFEAEPGTKIYGKGQIWHEYMTVPGNFDFLRKLVGRASVQVPAKARLYSIAVRENKRAFRGINPVPVSRTYPTTRDPSPSTTRKRSRRLLQTN